MCCVLPSSAWRTALGLGAPMGMPQAWRDMQGVPGLGTLHVLSLSVIMVTAATLTLGLVYRWGETVPRPVPVWGGRDIAVTPVVVTATTGAVAVLVMSVWAALNWKTVATARGVPEPGWYVLATAAYAPALLWGPLLLCVTYAYQRRRARNSTPGKAA